MKLKQILIDAVAAFIFFTACLTPYMILIVKTTLDQYIAWFIMQAVIIPPLGVVFSWIARKLKRKE